MRTKERLLQLREQYSETLSPMTRYKAAVTDPEIAERYKDIYAGVVRTMWQDGQNDRLIPELLYLYADYLAQEVRDEHADANMMADRAYAEMLAYRRSMESKMDRQYAEMQRYDNEAENALDTIASVLMATYSQNLLYYGKFQAKLTNIVSRLDDIVKILDTDAPEPPSPAPVTYEFTYDGSETGYTLSYHVGAAVNEVGFQPGRKFPWTLVSKDSEGNPVGFTYSLNMDSNGSWALGSLTNVIKYEHILVFKVVTNDFRYAGDYTCSIVQDITGEVITFPLKFVHLEPVPVGYRIPVTVKLEANVSAHVSTYAADVNFDRADGDVGLLYLTRRDSTTWSGNMEEVVPGQVHMNISYSDSSDPPSDIKGVQVNEKGCTLSRIQSHIDKSAYYINVDFVIDSVDDNPSIEVVYKAVGK
jgi:hypothetical protein